MPNLIINLLRIWVILFVYVIFMLFFIWVCIRALFVDWLLWLLVGAWAWQCFACRFIYSLLPLLRVRFVVAPCAMPFCGFGRCFVQIVRWAWLRQGSAGNGCKAALVSS